MATRTAAIYVGVGHPNCGGLIDPPGVTSWWLSEGSRAIWFSKLEAGRERGSGWLPRYPTSCLVDGLIAIFTSRVDEAERQRQPVSVQDTMSNGRVDLAEVSSDTYEGLLFLAKTRAPDFGGKLIVSAFQGSAILHQFDQVRDFDMDFEILAPVGTRLWNRWKEATQTTGILSDDEG